MSPVRASRLSNGRHRPQGFLYDQLPPGSLKRKLAFWVAVPLICLLLGYWIMDDMVMMAVTRHGSEFALPDYTGQTAIEAQLSLSELGLNHEIASHEYSPGKSKGIILNQFPISGTKVKSNRTIKFVVSAGQRLVYIPFLGGKSVRQAMLDLETVGLTLGEIAWAFSDTLPERVVVFSYPASDTEIPIGSPVNLMVNRGRASNFTYMPQAVGLTLDQAVMLLEDKSLRQGVITYRTDENYLPETVLEQSEPTGTELDVATEIDLVVSTTD
ncbi:MAG: PASTA domain-containing protein [candidate division Zixibacteria bacterium]|nr:PASTA domain-containing protein [candidate division Zixibacteria bacterium]